MMAAVIADGCPVLPRCGVARSESASRARSSTRASQEWTLIPVKKGTVVLQAVWSHCLRVDRYAEQVTPKKRQNSESSRGEKALEVGGTLRASQALRSLRVRPVLDYP